MTIPAVSLMVPVFNRPDLLVPCVESALAQTFTDLEVVVVDGASTDGTWDVCQRLAARDPRVRAIREGANSGPVGGWARCLEEAHGTYATFLWSDDLLMRTFLERTVPLVSDPAVAFAFTAAEIGAEPGSGAVAYLNRPGRIASDRFVDGALRGDPALPVSPACALFRLEDLRGALVDRLPTDPPVDLSGTGAGTDLLLYLRTAERYREVACVDEALAFFRAHPGSISIHGRAGLVRYHYAMARAWFASERRDTGLAATILARHWLSEAWSLRRPIAPWVAARRYAGLVGPAGLVAGSIRAVAQVVGQRLRRP